MARMHAAHLSAQGPFGQTALMLAIKWGHAKIATMLLEKTPPNDLQAKDAIGQTSLERAIIQGRRDIARSIMWRQHAGGRPLQEGHRSPC